MLNATFKALNRSFLDVLTQFYRATQLGIEGFSLLPQVQSIMPALTSILTVGIWTIIDVLHSRQYNSFSIISEIQ
jgi:hypothetical protein